MSIALTPVVLGGFDNPSIPREQHVRWLARDGSVEICGGWLSLRMKLDVP